MAQTKQIRIRRFLRNLGIPPHILGYTYLTEAIDYMVSVSDKTLLINNVYRHVAEIYTTSQSCVEASIRNAIRKAAKYKNPTFNRLFKNSESVVNHVFLNTLRDIFEEENLEYISQYLKYD